MKIDAETARYYSGLGDLVMLAWLAAGAEAGPDPLTFHRKRDLELMALLGLHVDPEPGGVVLDDVFAAEVADRGRRPRLEYIARHLGVQTPLARPALRIGDEDAAWAAATVGQHASPLVLLFPQVAWKPREWPANYWVDLAWKLKATGAGVLVMLQAEDPRFTGMPVFQWNTPLPRVAALMQRAALVIGNDSFPAHLAGTVGTPTLALLGPTRPSVFAHMDTVECITSAMDCTGCHFLPPFRAAFDQGCMSLYQLLPDDVLSRALFHLGRG